MEVRDLRYFLALAQELHFGRAAQRLHIAQPALSQQLKRLERELGLTLVERSSRHVRLTDAGERLATEAAEAVARFDAVAGAMARVRLGQAGTLVLGISPGVRPTLLRELLAAVAGRADTEVTTRGASTAEAPPMLRRHEIDAALLHGVEDVPELDHLVIEQAPLGVALPSGHRLARRRAVAARDLSGETMLWVARSSEPALHDRVLTLLTEAGYEPGPAQHPPTVDTSLNLVAAGLGVSLKFRHEVDTANRRGVVWRRFADVELSVATVLMWRRRDRAPLLAALIDAARAEAARSAARRP